MKKRAVYCLGLLSVACLIWLAVRHVAVSALVDSLKGHPINVSFNADFVRFIPGGKRSAMPVLLQSLQSENSLVRWNAGYAMRFLRAESRELTPTLVKLLAHTNPGVRWNAAYLLGEIGEEATPAMPALIAAMEDQHAGDVLNGGGPVQAKTFYELSKDQSVRSAAAEALGKLGPAARPAIQSLINKFNDANPFVRLDAAIAVWKIDKRADACVPVLLDLLKKQHGAQRDDVLWSQAAGALGAIGPDAKEAVPALIGVLSLGRGEAREQAASALGKIGSLAKAAEPALVKALADEDPFLRVKVAEALASINGQSAEATWALIDVLKDTSLPAFAREPAIRALGLFGPKVQGTIVALIEARSDTNSSVSSIASEALVSLAPEASRNPVATLNAVMVSKDPHLRVVAAEALWKFTGQANDAIPILVEALAAKGLLARRWAARALGDAKPEHRAVVLPALRHKLRDQDLQVRVFAAEAIWNIDGTSTIVIPALVDVLKDRNNPGRARERAAYALGRIGPTAKASIPTLTVARADEECWDVHVAASRALERVTPAPADGATAARQEGLPRVTSPYPPR